MERCGKRYLDGVGKVRKMRIREEKNVLEEVCGMGCGWFEKGVREVWLKGVQKGGGRKRKECGKRHMVGLSDVNTMEVW